MVDTTHGGEGLAPVVPLFGGDVPEAPAARDGAVEGADLWHTTWRGEVPGAARRPAAPSPDSGPSVGPDVTDEPGGEPDDATVVADRAETRLERALAARGMSEREARDRLRRDNVELHAIDDIVERLMRVGAIDDDRLAEQLVFTATTRKSQGRRAIAQSLAKRGIVRDAIDRALEDLPDDDAERALEFARSKAGPLARLAHDTALRRLVGQLARRGFGGTLAMSAANQALDEARGGGSVVRFR